MTDDEPQVEPLDPDQVPCPKCGAPAGEVCRQPNSKVAASIHTARRRAANPPNRSTSGPRSSPATPEGRSKGGKAAAQERRRRKSELSAQIEARKAAAEHAAIEAQADALAADAARYAVDRAKLRRATLDNALGAATRLGETLGALRRIELDEDGMPRTTPVEVFDRKTGLPVFDKQGERVVREDPIVKGYTTPSDVETLSKAAAQQLASVRLEEGKPTGIEQQIGAGGAREILGDVGVRELLEFARDNLPEGGQ